MKLNFTLSLPFSALRHIGWTELRFMLLKMIICGLPQISLRLRLDPLHIMMG